jgi:Ca2+-binding EF-hand superfamily protein
MNRRWPAISIALMLAAGASAQDKATYDQRNIARYVELFQTLDRDRDGTVTWSESQGDLVFTPRFNDIDVDRDGVVTRRELNRYLAIEHGLRTADSPFR